jgi:dextranase
MTDASGTRNYGLRSFYRSDDVISLAGLPEACFALVARRASGEVVEREVRAGAGVISGLTPGTYVVEAHDRNGTVVWEELTTVARHVGERPVHGFVTSFEDETVDEVLGWLERLRCTVVQAYDWMASYSVPLGSPSGWVDPSKRKVSFRALRALSEGLRERGAVAHAYAPVYAVDLAFGAEHPEMLLYRGDGEPERLFDQIQLANPGDLAWQRHFAASYGDAADRIGFGGFHLDTYGFPREARDHGGNAVDMRTAYGQFLESFRSRRPADLLSFNQVNGLPSAMTLPEGPAFRYCEVWPPNDAWRHLEALMDRSAGRAGMLGSYGRELGSMRGTVACYPPVWESSNRADAPAINRYAALGTVVRTEAVATCLGAGALLYGDRSAVLGDAYYPAHERLSASEAEVVLAWHRFALRCRDLFFEGEDTSWYDIGDDNGAVSVTSELPVRPEPLGQALFARVVRSETCVAVGIVDLSGSRDGRWAEGTLPGRCTGVRAKVLVGHPEDWDVAVAVLGRNGGRFAQVPFEVVAHREGLAVEVPVPMDAGWSVLRLARAVR